MKKLHMPLLRLLALVLSVCILLPGLALAADGCAIYPRIYPIAPAEKGMLMRSLAYLENGGENPVASAAAYLVCDAAAGTWTAVDGEALTGYDIVHFMADGTFYGLFRGEDALVLTHFGIKEGKVQVLDTVNLPLENDQELYWHGAAVLKGVAYVLWQPPKDNGGDLFIQAYDLATGKRLEKLPVEGAEIITATQDKLVAFLGKTGEYQCAAILYDPADQSQKTVDTNSLEDTLAYPRMFACDPVTGTCLVAGTKGFYKWDLETGETALAADYDLSQMAHPFKFFDGQLAVEGDPLQVFQIK